MGAALYYFTGTGNSLAVARRLSSRLGGPAPAPMARLLEAGEEVAPGEGLCGLVYPVHHWGPADLVLRFARLLRPREDAYVFAVATYGNHSGRAFQDLDGALGERGHGLDAGFHVRTVQNYVPVFPIPGGDGLRSRLGDADAKAGAVAEAVRGRDRGEREHWWYRPMVRTYYLSSKRRLHSKDSSFHVTEGCTSCGLCAEVCPVGNIELGDGGPVWLHRCEQCFGCLHWCPEGVIEWGLSTAGMGRYHHPEASVEDMRGQAPCRRRL